MSGPILTPLVRWALGFGSAVLCVAVLARFGDDGGALRIVILATPVLLAVGVIVVALFGLRRVQRERTFNEAPPMR